MREVSGDIWSLTYTMKADAVCITTNGYVTDAGKLVMGKGVALQARERFFGIDAALGKTIRDGYFGVQPLYSSLWKPSIVIAFPVKPAHGPNGEPGWKMPAQIDLIEKSAHELVAIANSNHDWFKTVLLPQPGTGAGRLLWKDVRPVIEPILDDRFVVVNYKAQQEAKP